MVFNFELLFIEDAQIENFDGVSSCKFYGRNLKREILLLASTINLLLPLSLFLCYYVLLFACCFFYDFFLLSLTVEYSYSTCYTLLKSYV